jgi:hypothetical protein
VRGFHSCRIAEQNAACQGIMPGASPAVARARGVRAEPG